MKNNYDSTKDTLIHIKRVNELLSIAAVELISRGSVHDDSKLEKTEALTKFTLTPFNISQSYPKAKLTNTKI